MQQQFTCYLHFYTALKFSNNVLPKPHAWVSLPLQSYLGFVIFTPEIFIIKKAFLDFKARLSFNYIYLLIKGSVKFRSIILLAFIVLTESGIQHDTAKYCVLFAVIGYYVYMLRNVKFNIFNWLYVLASLCLALSIIITFWLLLSLALPIILPILTPKLLLFLAVIETSFLEAYNLSMNPDAGGDPSIGGSSGAGAGGSDGGSNGPDGPDGDTGSVALAASSDHDNDSDNDDAPSNNLPALDSDTRSESGLEYDEKLAVAEMVYKTKNSKIEKRIERIDGINSTAEDANLTASQKADNVLTDKLHELDCAKEVLIEKLNNLKESNEKMVSELRGAVDWSSGRPEISLEISEVAEDSSVNNVKVEIVADRINNSSFLEAKDNNEKAAQEIEQANEEMLLKKEEFTTALIKSNELD